MIAKTGQTQALGKGKGKAATKLTVPARGDVVFLLKTDKTE